MVNACSLCPGGSGSLQSGTQREAWASDRFRSCQYRGSLKSGKRLRSSGEVKREEKGPKAKGNYPWSLLSKYSPLCGGEEKPCIKPQNARQTELCTLVRDGQRVPGSGMGRGLG